MKGLLFLISVPFKTRMTGAILITKDINARRELAQWYPRFVYMLEAARGRKAANKFSPKQIAALALAAYRS